MLKYKHAKNYFKIRYGLRKYLTLHKVLHHAIEIFVNYKNFQFKKVFILNQSRNVNCLGNLLEFDK